jgi:hypothetical protein
VCVGSTKDEEGVVGGCGVVKELGGKFFLEGFGVCRTGEVLGGPGAFSVPSEIVTPRVGFRGVEFPEWPSKLFDLVDRVLVSLELGADRLLLSLDLVGVFALIEERLECPSEKTDSPDPDRAL